MERTQVLRHLVATLAVVARQRGVDEAARAGWPLPPRLALHLWLYAEGLIGPTPTDPVDFE